MSSPIRWMHAFVDVPDDRVAMARDFWSAAAGWPPGGAWPGHPEFTSLVPATGTPYLHVQTIGGPPRVHLDLTADPATDVTRLEALGASRGPVGDGWQAMASPAGLPFCVCTGPDAGERPGAHGWPGGHRTRLVQLCVDVPDTAYADELAFWREATGWADEEVPTPEFHRLVHRSRSSLQLLVQRLGPDDPGTTARAHLDLGTTDMDAEVARLEVLGARVLWPGNGFVALQDPTGLAFCVTDNDPDR